MDRPEFTPRTWYSQDGKWKFMMDKHGITDIIPASVLEKYLETHRLKASNPYKRSDAHIHWAL